MTDAEHRPDPDALLAELARATPTPGRGRLKIFFGFSPGVGKTYAMLESARRLVAGGTDVVVGIVETHGREETARLLEGLEVLPRVDVAYRGHVLREFDRDGALARRPAVLLVDELAHANAPGMRHSKRWQDIADVLAAGIDVHTTLNVQHVESLVDIVEQSTGVRVRETVPDTVLDAADDIELVDLPPDELIRRLHEGKIYLPEVARTAVERFFKRKNLLHLRELALLRLARRVGADADATRRGAAGRPAGITERIVVGVGAGSGSPRAVRDAARIAAGLRAEVVAVNVRTPFERPPAAEAVRRLEDTLRLAESIGARVERVVGRSVAAGLLEEARRLDATRIVVGRPGRPVGWRPFGTRTLDRLVAEAGPIDVVVAGVPDPIAAFPVPSVVGDPHDVRIGIATAVTLAVGGMLLVGRWLRPWVDDLDMAVVSLLLVVAASLRFGRGAGIFTVVVAALGIDLLFIHPEFEFAVADTKKILSLAILLSVGIVVAELIVRMRDEREMAYAAERRVGRLLELSRRLAAAGTADEVAGALAWMAADVTGAAVEVLSTVPTGLLRVAAHEGRLPDGTLGSGVMLWSHTFGQPAGRGTATFPGAAVSCFPLHQAGRALGVLVVGFAPPRDPTRDELDMLSSAVRQATDRLVRLAPARSPPG